VEAQIQASASPEQVNTTALKETCVVPTLESPIPQYNNAIWCGTLQLAWNKLKNDIIREPIGLIGADRLSGELNNARLSAHDLDAGSFYADAGLVSDGILERIGEQMAKRFPAEPKPLFSGQYTQALPTIVAYSYLYVNIPFTPPFSNRPFAFTFRQSNGKSVETTSFCGLPRAARDQVDVLDYDACTGFDRAGFDTAEFVVDLCKSTEPYQIILARIPCPRSLGEGVASVEERIARFREKSDYGNERKLKQEDSLIVPDVLFKLQHHFGELEGRSLANVRFEGYHLFEVVQIVDFGLSRTGLTLKSEVRLGTTRAGPAEKPRYLHFDRPFLIYIKKRAASSSPFCVMWVDNGELMKKWRN